MEVIDTFHHKEVVTHLLNQKFFEKSTKKDVPDHVQLEDDEIFIMFFPKSQANITVNEDMEISHAEDSDNENFDKEDFESEDDLIYNDDSSDDELGYWDNLQYPVDEKPMVQENEP